MSEVALRHLRAADPRLAALIGRVGPFELRVRTRASTFAVLGQAIVYQQLTGRAAATILGRLKALGPRPRAFPAPADLLGIADDRLRGAGLSRAKAAALQDLARKVLDGTVPAPAALQRMEDEQVVDRLTQVRGVGRWTAEMFLIFRLGRLDVLPAQDYGIRKGFAVAFRMRDLPTPTQLVARGERWRPYRTVAAWYLWRALDLDRPRDTSS